MAGTSLAWSGDQVVILSTTDQQAIALLKERDEGLPLRFTNCR